MRGLFGRPYGSFGGQKGGAEREQPPLPTQPTPVGDKAFLDTTKGKFAALGDLLLRASGRGGNPMLQYGMQQDFLRQRDQQAQQAAALRLQNQQSLHDYKLQNPMPTKPDAFEKALSGAGIDPSSPQAKELYAGRAASMAANPNDEFVVVPLPGGRTYAGPKSGLNQSFGNNAPVLSDIEAELKRRGVI